VEHHRRADDARPVATRRAIRREPAGVAAAIGGRRLPCRTPRGTADRGGPSVAPFDRAAAHLA
jgi:hypothetical protein